MYRIICGTQTQYNFAIQLCTLNAVIRSAVPIMATNLNIEVMCSNFNVTSEGFYVQFLRGWNALELVLILLLLVIQYNNNNSLHFN